MPSVFISILSLLAVAMTSIFVIKNRVGINAVLKNNRDTKQNLNSVQSKQNVEMNALVNEVNKQHRTLDQQNQKNHSAMKQLEAREKKREQLTQQRINKYQTITNANFVGMNKDRKSTR